MDHIVIRVMVTRDYQTVRETEGGGGASSIFWYWEQQH